MVDNFPLHQGLLIKSPPLSLSGYNIKRWRTRWFVLRKDMTLSYYESRNGHLIKSIDLSNCTSVEKDLQHKKFKNVFSLKVNGGKMGRTFYLVAGTPYEMESWVKEICNLLEFEKLDVGSLVLGPSPSKETFHIAASHVSSQSKDESQEVEKERPDSGIHVSLNENNNTDTLPDYDIVQPPREINNGDKQLNYNALVTSGYDIPPNNGRQQPRDARSYDVPPSHDVAITNDTSNSSSYDIVPPPNSPYDIVPPPNSPYDIVTRTLPQVSSYDIVPPAKNHLSACPLDPPLDYYSQRESQPTYDVPPSHMTDDQQTYDIPPSQLGDQPTYDFPPPQLDDQPTYDIPPSQLGDQPTYDFPPRPQLDDQSTYDFPPSKLDDQPTYDIPPRPDDQPTYDIPPQSAYDFVPAREGGSSNPEIYDYVSQHNQYKPHYQSPAAQHGTIHSDYDQVPAPHEIVPPLIPRTNKINQYVNLTIPGKSSVGYNKPLPIIPDHSDERDSGTGADIGLEDNYDVPPSYDKRPPMIDRSSKPGASTPVVDRSSKPKGIKEREYVNLGKSSTFRETRPQLRKSNLNRSRSSVGDREAEGEYLSMESPTRTNFTTSFSKKNKLLPPVPDDEDEDEKCSYEFMKSPIKDVAYENYSPEDLGNPSEATPIKQLKGNYQDVDFLYPAKGPAVSQRHSRTNYTTIDLEKTKGFRKTRKELNQGD